VPKEVIEAVARFRRKSGPQWKSRLKIAWQLGSYAGVSDAADVPLLDRALQMIGPRRLYKIKV
jgi:hypothetical protein